MRQVLAVAVVVASVLSSGPGRAAYDLEVPANPWDEYRMQFKKYSQQLLRSYDRAFVDDYPGAIAEATKAIELLPDEGMAYAERAKYHRLLNNQKESERDFRKALALFDQAIERYKPGKKKTPPGGRKTDPAEAARLVTTLRYQRGEALFGFERYHQAAEDFAVACQGGSAIACSRMWEVKMIEKRGTNWVPLSSRQFYDRQRVERPTKDVVRVWLRREDGQAAQGEGPEGALQQHLELRCGPRDYRVIEGLVVSGSGEKSPAEAETQFAPPAPGSGAGKLLIMLCPSQNLK